MIETNRKFEIKEFNQLPREEKMKYLISLAALAPSSHNIQPWLFHIEDNKIILSGSKSRKLPGSDKVDREYYLSLGAALGNLLQASEAYGLGFEVKKSLEVLDGSVAEITYSDLTSSKVDEDALISIIDRHTNRFPFEPRKLSEEFIERIKSYSNSEIRIDVVTSPDQLAKVSEAVEDSIEAAFLDKEFTNELSQWMRPSLKKYEDGMVGYNLAVPWIMSFVLPWMIKHVNVSKQQRKMNHTPLVTASAFVIISANIDNKQNWIDGGQIFDRIAVEAQKNEIKVGVQGAPIEIGNHYQKLQEILGITQRPLMFFRLGYCKQVPKTSPRLSIDKIII